MANKKSKSKKKKPAGSTVAKVELEKSTEVEETEEAETSTDVKKSEKTDAKAKSKAKAKDTSAKKKPNPVVKYLRDLRSEFKKVVWPAKETVFNNTGIVLVTMIITGAGIFGIDLVFAQLFKILLSLGNGA